MGNGITDPLYQSDWWPIRKRRSSCWVEKWTGRFLDFLVLPRVKSATVTCSKSVLGCSYGIRSGNCPTLKWSLRGTSEK